MKWVKLNADTSLWEILDYDDMCSHSFEKFELDIDAGRVVRCERYLHKFAYLLGSHGECEQGGYSPAGSRRKVNVDTHEQDVFRFEPHELIQNPGICQKRGSTKENDVYFGQRNLWGELDQRTGHRRWRGCVPGPGFAVAFI